MIKVKVKRFMCFIFGSSRIIQRAINKVAKKGGGDVIIPSGTYKLKKEIKGPMNVNMR